MISRDLTNKHDGLTRKNEEFTYQMVRFTPTCTMFLFGTWMPGADPTREKREVCQMNDDRTQTLDLPSGSLW